MRQLKGLIIAFSLYSAIPVPQFEWKEEDMKYTLCFFPWVGAVAGALVFLWCTLCESLSLGGLCRVLVGTAIPLFVTGGFHVDGFMDTMDAFHSCRSRERKLEILKDSHIGAFSVIMLAAFGLVWLGAFSEIRDLRLVGTICAGFFLSRCLSGSAWFPSIRQKKAACFIFCQKREKGPGSGHSVRSGRKLRRADACPFGAAGAVMAGAAFASFLYYDFRTKKELGGVTGDTSGYFVLLCEGSMMAAAAVAQTLVKLAG